MKQKQVQVKLEGFLCMHLTFSILLLELPQRDFLGFLRRSEVQIKKEISKKSNKCCHQSFQNQITNCITGLPLSLQMLHSRSSHLSIIQMRAKLLEEDRCPMHILFSSHTFFPEAALIQQIQTQSYKGRDVPPFLLSALQGLRDPQHGDTGLCFAQSPSFSTLRYHHSPWAEQSLSSLGLLRTRPFTLQDVNYQLSSGFNGTRLHVKKRYRNVNQF